MKNKTIPFNESPISKQVKKNVYSYFLLKSSVAVKEKPKQILRANNSEKQTLILRPGGGV